MVSLKQMTRQEDDLNNVLDDLSARISQCNNQFETYLLILERGDNYLKFGKTKEAKDDFSEAINMFPDAFLGYQKMAYANIEEARYDNAYDNLTEAIRLASHSVQGETKIFQGTMGKLHLKRAFVRFQYDDHDGVKEDLNTALEYMPNDHIILTYMGLFDIQKGDIESGRKILEPVFKN